MSSIDAQAKLVRAGYVRQSHAGIFHMLPLGQRVQEKLERLVDKYMIQIGASKVSLSSISSQALWEQTGRLQGYGPELFRFADRKNASYLLAPTHEEEITALVSRTVKSYKTLPLRLYQIGRKYRDEKRPRHGMLRSREFIMKDLYTFDYSTKSALSTYEEVRSAYSRLFAELKLPYLVAEASSGDIGGDLSHEYHLPTSIGEDSVISCSSCDYVANEELAAARPEGSDQTYNELQGRGVIRSEPEAARVWRGVSKDRSTLINVWYPEFLPGANTHELSRLSDADLNTHAMKTVLPELDSSLGDSISFWMSTSPPSTAWGPRRIVNMIDCRLGRSFSATLRARTSQFPILPPQSDLDLSTIPCSYIDSQGDGGPLNLIRIRDGDSCPRCSSGSLKVQKAIELGHTFYLGTRYSTPLGAHVQIPAALVENELDQSSGDKLAQVPMQMGCHGIGVSRILGAVTDHLADDRGLNWPRVIAPFEVVVIPGRGFEEEGAMVAEALAGHGELNAASKQHIDTALDDRSESLPWKMKDADLVGYPVLVILGRKWESERLCEVQCRRLKIKWQVSPAELPMYVDELLCHL
ncbi:hypothetical protein DL770_010639 [Monosporascus sp. CRB-9-2]|nr:hypothetical protein DL770_010639 [Monosporascus sp. CRB-9-2]